MQEINRILVVRTDRIGDVILTLPVIAALRRKFVHAHITLLMRHYTADIVQGNPGINEIIFDDEGDKEIPLLLQIQNIRSQKFDVVIVVKPSWRLALLFFFAGIPLRIGTGYRLYSFLFNKKIYEHRRLGEQHESEYNLSLLQPLGIIPSEKIYPQLFPERNSVDEIQELLKKYNVNDTFIIIHPGSGGSSKNWSAANFGALGKKLSAENNVQILITGGRNETELVRNVAAFIGKEAIVLQEHLPLQKFIALISLAKLFIANSTGPLHIASALGIYAVGFFPQHPAMGSKRWGPYAEKKLIFSPKNKSRNCADCNYRSHCDCMNSISVDEVYAGVQNIIQSNFL
ncbi:MAG: glycosyltransferase family 9 protein [Bacteroidota bacterium]